MKKLIFLTVCFSIGFLLKAQVLYENDFDNLSAGSYLAQSHPDWWTTWSNNPGTSEDALVSNEQSVSAPHSAKCAWGTDLVFKAGNKTTGAYTIDFDIYIPNNGRAYFNLLHIFNSAESEWGVGVYFNHPEQGTGVNNNGILTPFTFPYDTWFPISMFVDLDNDIANIKINNIQYLEWQFSIKEWGSPGERQLAATNFYPPQAGAVFYIDNFVYKRLTEGNGPAISVSPSSIYEEVAEGAGAAITKQITVTNSGTSMGDYYTWLTYDFIPIAGSDVFTLKQCGEYDNSLGFNDAPVLVELGVKFSGNDLCDKVGAYITKMSYYLPYIVQNNSLTFRIYGPNKSSSPGEILMEFTKTDNVLGMWNDLILPQPLLIDRSELWLSVEFFHLQDTYPIGVDDGPFKSGVNYVKRNGGVWNEFSNQFGNFLLTAEATGAAVGCWLSLTGNTNGSIPGGNNANFNAVLNPAGLDADAYRANINIATNDLDNPIITIPCTLVVLPSQPAPIIYVTPNFIDETTSETVTITKQITVTNYGNDAGAYEAWLEDVSDNWISLTGNTTGSVTGGGNNETFNAVINTAALDYGTYTATLKVSTTDTNHPLFTIPCTLVYEAPPPPPMPHLSVSPTSIDETTDEAGVITRQITITNTGDGAGTYEAWLEGADDWISLSGATTGTVLSDSSETFDVLLNAENLDNGTYTATIKISTDDPENELFEIPCTLIVSKEGIELLTTGITVYPNPTKELLTVKISNPPQHSTSSLTLFDMQGRVITRQPLVEENKIDISAQPAGTYVMQVAIGTEMTSWKIVKQ